MEQIETIDLDVEESNELAFRLKMEGVGTNPVKVRLVCESKDVSYMFNGYQGTEMDTVHFTMPEMKNRLNEGTYPARVEVLVDNRYFSPVKFNINFKKTMKVVAEAIQVTQKPVKQEIKITATPISIKPPVSSTQQPQAQAPQKQKTNLLAQVVESEKKGMKNVREEAFAFLKNKGR